MAELPPDTRASLGATPSPARVALDPSEVAPLIAQLRQDLDAINGADIEGPQLVRLRAEVARLSELLNRPELPREALPDHLESLHGLLSQTSPGTARVELEALKAASYLSAIGRMLGLD